MVRILTIGASCCSPNKGAAAMELSTLHSLEQLIPDAAFSMFTPFPNCKPGSECCVIHNVRQVDIREHPLKRGLRVFRSGLWFLLRRYLGLNVKPLIDERLLREYVETDVIVDISGDSFSDDYGTLQSISVCSSLLPAIFLGKPVCIYPQSIGPFKSKLTRLIAHFTLNKVKFIIAREKITEDYLRKLAVKAPVYLAPDISFLLHPAHEEVIKEMLRKENINKNGRPLIGMSISQSIARFAKSEDRYDWYIESMSLATEHLVGKLGAIVMFVPEVIGPGEVFDDRVMCRLILEKAKCKGKVLCITSEYQPEELRGLIGQCELFIGARMHANIAALSMCVPTIAIAYSHKTQGIMKMLGMDKYVLDFRNMTVEQLVSKISDAWENREEIRAELARRIPQVKEQALLSGELVKELVDFLNHGWR
jgi:colanic acid/amylovoran biosynthesis protein